MSNAIRNNHSLDTIQERKANPQINEDIILERGIFYF